MLLHLVHGTLTLYQGERDIFEGTADESHVGFHPSYKIHIASFKSQLRRQIGELIFSVL